MKRTLRHILFIPLLIGLLGSLQAVTAADTTPPLTIPSPSMGTFNTPQNVTLTCNDSTGSGCEATYYCLGNSCTPTTVYSTPISITESSTLRFFSRDIDGNLEQVRNYSYTIDPTLLFSFDCAWPNIPQQWYFNLPKGIAIDANDNVYVVDYKNNRVSKFDNSGYLVNQWGSTGSGDGQFNFPYGVAVDSNGNVFVSDGGNHRIQKFDNNGNLVTQWPAGIGGGQFDSLYGVAVDDNRNVFVADNANKRIQKFDNSGSLVTQWSTGSGNLPFSGVSGVAVDTNNNVYVVEGGNNRVHKFDNDGNFINLLGNEVQIFPSNVAVDSNGNVYVLEVAVGQGVSRVQKFDGNGNSLTSWGTIGSSDGQFNYPWGVAVDSKGNVYVADQNNRIQKFDSNGNFLYKWDSAGSGDGQFSTPNKIAVDTSSNIYITDGNNNRVQKFDSNGNYLTQWGTLSVPRGIGVDANGQVFVSVPNSIKKYDGSGNSLNVWGSYGTGNGQFNNPNTLAVDRTGNIFVADASNKPYPKVR
ncbi:E3 ubiquitin-protein ligase TRIM71 [Geobacter sp. OR-1]|uniref:SBBP repeat-containing protein n=1 Tax=Geobacter sp. OR-1 TaxID=1266765 RepID=UPI0005437BCE|nr:SBBP repeat-containing protein [Geobacter sp. OR-1]GAM09889.1 E3 ubiquitin-protein ligase TRIM71 [Geobacter sp. OR-1]